MGIALCGGASGLSQPINVVARGGGPVVRIPASAGRLWVMGNGRHLGTLLEVGFGFGAWAIF